MRGKDGIPKPVDHHDYDLALEFYGDVPDSGLRIDSSDKPYKH